MPKPPPRSSSGIVTPSSADTWACSASTRRAATSNPEVSKICDPMWLCSPSSSRPGASSTRRTASSASPEVIEKPNFWSSCAVAMYSWVCASTPAVTRTSTRAVARQLLRHRGQPLDLVERVDDDPADAGLHRAAQLPGGLVVAVVADPRRVEPGPQRDGQLTGRAHVEAQPLLRDPARDRRAQEGLAGVVDVVVGERLPERPGARPEVGLVEDVRRGAVLGDQVAQVDAADLEGAVVGLAGRRGPQQRDEGVDVRGGTQPGRARGRSRRRAPAGLVRAGHYIRSGAVTPSSRRPLAKTVRVASTSSSRARWIGAGSSSPMGSTRQAS